MGKLIIELLLNNYLVIYHKIKLMSFRLFLEHLTDKPNSYIVAYLIKESKLKNKKYYIIVH